MMFSLVCKFILGLSDWIPSITNMLWHCFSSSIGKENLYKNQAMNILFSLYLLTLFTFPRLIQFSFLCVFG